MRWWLQAILLSLFCAPLFAQKSATRFGFNYWPQGYGCNVLTDANWNEANKAAIKSDLDLMRSLDARIIRLNFWPSGCGFEPAQGISSFRPEFNQIQKHLPELMKMLHARGLKVIIAFANTYLSSGPEENNPDGLRWWQLSYVGYSNTPDGFTAFTNDSVKWINGIISAVEATHPANATVLYYDYQNEYSQRVPKIGQYLRILYDLGRAPAGKRGISVLEVPVDVDAGAHSLKNEIKSRFLDYVDFHSYPATAQCPFNADVGQVYGYIKSKFPGSVIVLGEYGGRALQQEDLSAASGRNCDGVFAHVRWDEPQQVEVESAVINGSRGSSIPYVLHWMLWDYTPAAPPPRLLDDPNNNELQVFGIGYKPHQPKDVLGMYASYFSLAPNPDMEIVSNETPQGWAAGGDQPVQLVSAGPSTSDAATKSYYARIVRTKATNKAVWIQSDLIPAAGGSQTYFNAYVRSNMSKVRLEINEYNASRKKTRTVSGPMFTPCRNQASCVEWHWHNYLHSVGSWSITTRRDTRYVIVAVLGRPNVAPAYLDVDAVSLAQSSENAFSDSH